MVDRSEWYDSLSLFLYRLFFHFMLKDFEYLEAPSLLKTLLPQDALGPYLAPERQFLINHHVQKSEGVSCFELIFYQWPRLIWSWYPSNILYLPCHSNGCLLKCLKFHNVIYVFTSAATLSKMLQSASHIKKIFEYEFQGIFKWLTWVHLKYLKH